MIDTLFQADLLHSLHIMNIRKYESQIAEAIFEFYWLKLMISTIRGCKYVNFENPDFVYQF